jgi:chemotaxis protein CheZ
MSGTSASNDSADLEALFDSIASSAAAPPPPPPAPVAAPAKPSVLQQLSEGGATDDSDELQALFDSVAGQRVDASGAQVTDSGEAPDKVFKRVGHMMRQLHDTLHDLGYDKVVEKTVAAIPDARDRLAYIANLTEQAACRVLNATDIANPLLDEIEGEAAGLATRWDALFANQMPVSEFKRLAEETRGFLRQGLPQHTGDTKAQLLEIMMAQDFQDLTGQVIKKVIALAQDLESQLMGVLIETMPGDLRNELGNEGLLNGPVVNADGRTDVVASQQQVDDLLDSLGF